MIDIQKSGTFRQIFFRRFRQTILLTKVCLFIIISRKGYSFLPHRHYTVDLYKYIFTEVPFKAVEIRVVEYHWGSFTIVVVSKRGLGLSRAEGLGPLRSGRCKGLS